MQPNAEINEKKVELDGETFFYREAGDPDAVPVVLLHATTQDATTWDKVASALAPNHRVLAPHLRGHGPSPHVGPYGFEVLRRDVTCFVNRLGLDRFSLVGHSMGGVAAYLFAEEQPRRLIKLVIEDTPPPLPGHQWKVPRRPPGPLPFDWEATRTLVGQLREPDPEWAGRLGDILTPTLLIAGGMTGQVDSAMAEKIAGILPDCRISPFEGAGHHVHAGQAGDFIKVLGNFLAN